MHLATLVKAERHKNPLLGFLRLQTEVMCKDCRNISYKSCLQALLTKLVSVIKYQANATLSLKVFKECSKQHYVFTVT